MAYKRFQKTHIKKHIKKELSSHDMAKDVGKRLEFIKEVGEEILTEKDLQELLEKKAKLVAYDGFEPSGTNIHIAQGIMRAININKLAKAGVSFTMLIADWHAWANNKLGGDLEKIQKVGKYFIEVWKLCDMDMKHVKFVWASDLVKDDAYWKQVMQVARHSTLNRVIRCGQIMGRSEKDVLQASQILYPCMQCADIFYLKADICQLGMDQRKVNVLAREIGPKLGWGKPVAVHHHMLMGLGEPPQGEDSIEKSIAMKMSKSNPDSAIFMTDSEEEIKRKIKKAYCPAKQVDENPMLDYAKHLIFGKFTTCKIERPEKFGGSLSFESYADLEKAFKKGDLHPMDLKNGVAVYIDKLIKPVREGIQGNTKLKKLHDEIQGFEVTR
jgi:tyrosyl-tRNA synthetase